MAALVRYGGYLGGMRTGAESRAKRVIERAEEAMDTAVRGLEVSTAAFGFGVWNGRVGGGGASLGPVPIDLLFGVGFHLFGFFGKGRNAAHWHAFGDGAMASYFATLGAKVGNQWKKSGKLWGILGEDPTGGGSLADADLARMVRPE